MPHSGGRVGKGIYLASECGKSYRSVCLPGRGHGSHACHVYVWGSCVSAYMGELKGPIDERNGWVLRYEVHYIRREHE